jgi:hypothetical protein
VSFHLGHSFNAISRPANLHFRPNSILKDEMALFAAIRFAGCWV